MTDRHAGRDHIENTGSGNVIIHNYGAVDTPVAVLEPWQTVPAAIPGDRVAPSVLLDVRRRVVPMVGRQAMLTDISAWRDNTDLAVSVRLYYGPGGRGKTRLALQSSDEAVSAGWQVWSARQVPAVEVAGEDQANFGDVDSVAGRLVTIDYAERWPAQLLCAFIAQLSDRSGDIPLRVLLLARHASWWAPVRSVLAALEKVQIDANKAIELSPLPADGADRRRLFASACQAFGNAAMYHGTVEPSDIDPPDEIDSHPSFSKPLTVLMEALAAVDAHSQRQPRPTPEVLTRYLLDREIRLWQQANDPDKLARTAYCATLVGEQPLDVACDVLTKARVLADVHAAATEQLLMEHGEFYPPTPGLLLAPLIPDRLGEEFLALTTPGAVDTPDQTAEFASPGLAAWTRSAFPATNATSSPAGWLTTVVSNKSVATPRAARAITVLAEAAANWPHLTRHIDSLLQRAPHVALSAGNATLSALSRLPCIASETLEAVVMAHPPQSDPNLDLGLADLAQQWALRQLPDATAEDQAMIHNKLGYRLYCVGQYNQALASSLQASKLYKQLSQGDDNYLPDLAATLLNHGANLASTGQDAAMLAINENAIDIYTQLCERDESKYGPPLTKALQNQSSIMAHRGCVAEAQAASQRGVDVLKRLAETNSQHRQLFAALLAEHSANLGRANQYALGLAVSQEAFDVVKEVPDDGSSEYQDTLATVLGNHSEHLAQAGRLDEALSAGQRAINIRTRQANIIPARYNQALFYLLISRSSQLIQAGRLHEALETNQRAVDLFPQRSDRSTPSAQAELARALHNQSQWLSRAERDNEALIAVEAAINTLSHIATIDGLYQPVLAQSLGSYSVQLMRSGRPQDAAASSKHAINIYQQLVETDPNRYQPNLAESLHLHSGILAFQGQLEVAIDTSQRAIDLWQHLARIQPDRYNPILAQALHNHAVLQMQIGQYETAVQISKQAVDLRTTLANINPIHLPDLVDSLRNFAGHLENFGQSREALLIKHQADSIDSTLNAPTE